ncbi:helix-turn-helix domain-containing protein [Formosa haliotis]|uniref:helix-turn-helix domain-containing protein n=1 Tax=Formosa haliotis TaxID=1555194 RepID=UPI0008249138|nr:helix-turn-helix transcriptional regulator [Formosa haliotis]
MNVFNSIEELLAALKISRKMVFPDFFIFKFDEINYGIHQATFPHFKRFFEISFFEENSNKVQIGHTTIQDLNNTITFTSPMQSLSINRKTQPIGVSILFDSNFFSPQKHQYNIQHEFSFFKLKSQPAYKLNVNEQAYVKSILEHIYTEHEHHDAQSFEIIQGYLIILLNYLKRILKDNSANLRLKRYEEITIRFEELILQEDEGYNSISEYANQLNISPIYLSECVKRATGLTAKKILSNYQMLRAKSLLIQTSLSVEAIAHQMGFDEATNFIKFFKNNENQTPLAYRKQP